MANFKHNGRLISASSRAQAIRQIIASRKACSGALSAESVIVGTIDESNPRKLASAKASVAKKYKGLELASHGCTVTVRGKLCDVFNALNDFGGNCFGMWTDNGNANLVNACGESLGYEDVEQAASATVASARKASAGSSRIAMASVMKEVQLWKGTRHDDAEEAVIELTKLVGKDLSVDKEKQSDGISVYVSGPRVPAQ